MTGDHPPSPPTGADARGTTRQEAVAVISAYGAFRLLIILLAIWSFIEGFALFTGGLGALTFGGDRTAEQVIGLQLIVFVPVYALLAWQRDRYRLLIWVPYGAQLAIIVPTGWALLRGDPDGLLLLIISAIFFVLLFYFWWHSHPLDFFQGGEGEEDDEFADEDERGEGSADGDGTPHEGADAADGGRQGGRGRRYRRLPPKPE